MLRLLGEEGLLTDASIGSLTERSLRRDACDGMNAVAIDGATPYGTVMTTINVNGVTVEIVNPFAYIYKLCTANRELFRLMCINESNTHRKLVLYIDEVRPGNPLRPDKARQTQCIYWTFADFPDKFLVDVETWFLASVVRSTIVETIPCKVSALMGALLKLFFNPSGTSWATGVLLTNGNSSALLTAEFKGFMADEKALKEIFVLKGAAGTRPCPTCANVVQFMEPSGRMVGVGCVDRSLLVTVSDADLYAMADELKAHRGTKASLQRLERALGITFDKHNLLYDEHLRTIVRPVSHYLRDWMHVIVGHGVANTEIALLLTALASHGIKSEMVVRFASAFVLPKALGSLKPADLFAWSRISDDSMRGFAAEILTMVPLLATFVQDAVVPLGILADNVESFLKLHEILRILTSGPSAAAARADELQSLIDRHHIAFVRAYGTSNCKPKFHHMLHLPSHAAQLGKFLSCFVTERKHKTVKTTGTWVFNEYEHTLLRTLVFKQISALGDRNMYLNECLLHPKSGSIGGVQVTCATSAKLVCGEVRKDDYIAISGRRVGRVINFFELDGNVFAQASLLGTGTVRMEWVCTLQVEFVPSSEIVAPLTFAVVGSDRIRVIPPPGRW